MNPLSTVLVGVLVFLITLCIKAFALSAVNRLVAAWVRLYTWRLPAEIRDRRRVELSSDLHEHRHAGLSEGHKPGEVAAQIFFRFLAGILADASWSMGERIRLLVGKANPHAETIFSPVRLLRGVARYVDSKDPYTSQHSQRVADFAVRLAQALGLPEPETRNIRAGALLHDIGKAGIPVNVIQKPGPLTPGEQAVLRRHSEIGASMIRWIPFAGEVANIVLHNHENWDGSGYPLGLKGDEIPLGARIVFVADAFDALTTDRPYRRGASKAETLEVFKKHAGIQFDPAVVTAFESVVSTL